MVTNLNKVKNIEAWWNQFPLQLQLITKIRFFTSCGAGGVIYLTSLIFNNIGLSATDIGIGFTISAIIGTLTRIIAGNYLNKECNIKIPLRLSLLFGFISSLILLFSYNKISYLLGQGFIGAAAGIYWPSVEFAVANFSKGIDNRRAYTLVRSSEATGIFFSVLTGSVLSLLFYIKFVYVIDLIFIFSIFNIIEKQSKNLDINIASLIQENIYQKNHDQRKWNKNCFLILISIVLLTTCLALIQVTLPLDFVSGGVKRLPYGNNIIGYLISFQLLLSLVLQWPIGNWISNKGRLFGLKFSLFSFGFSSLLLFSSSYLKASGIFLMIIAIILCSVGTTSFLPSSTDVVYQIAPSKHKGSAFALLSQCFAMGYFVQIISGKLLDYFGNASNIWIGISLTCFFMMIILSKKRL